MNRARKPSATRCALIDLNCLCADHYTCLNRPLFSTGVHRESDPPQ